MNHHLSSHVSELLAAVALAGVWTLAVAGGAAIGGRRLQRAAAENELATLARALSLNIDGEVLEGARRGVLVRLERQGVKGNDLGAWRIELLDPQGPAGLDLGREGFVTLPSGPDMPLGDPPFDDEVHVAAEDAAVALASLPPSSREVVLSGVRQGWVRHGAAWRLGSVGAVSEMLHIAIEQGLKLCMCLRWEGVGLRHRLRMRCADPARGVAAQAMRLRIERGWVDEDELPSLRAHRSPEVAVWAAVRLRDVDWLADQAQRSSGRELRIRAILALHGLGVPERLPMAAEATLLRGLDGALRDECLAALAEHGGERALAHLSGVAGAERTVARIQERRSRQVGGLSLADAGGGHLSVAED